MEIYLLDMGVTKYGDCILVVKDNLKILIDGGHPSDANSITFQLSKILKIQPPFELDLLVVTHCHSDHIGCLPELVDLGTITTKTALLADQKLGFGDDSSGKGPIDSVTGNLRGLLIAMQEEDHSDLDDDGIEQFLFDAARLEDKYKGMIQTLDEEGTKIIRYGQHKDDELAELEQEFESVGLKILGPTREHLVICADLIAKSTASDVAQIPTSADTIHDLDLVDVYKNLVRNSHDDLGADRPGIGAAKNNQSIVLSFESNGWKALLAGDMQFGKAEVPGLKQIMKNLLTFINESNSYDFIKLSHHTSYNGITEEIFHEWNKYTTIFAHTGGRKDPGHPDKGVLDLLKANKENLTFARTDRNGIIKIFKEDDGLKLAKSKGSVNDFSSNDVNDELQTSTAKPEPATTPFYQPNIQHQETEDDRFVEITARIPHTTTKVTLTIDVEPKKKIAEVKLDKYVGRFRGLVFLTSSTKLDNNIGSAATDIMRLVKSIPETTIIDIPSDVTFNAEDVHRFLRNKIPSGARGVIILGGYDVVPAHRLNTINNELRSQIATAGQDDFDADDFIVWSDDIYGDLDGDYLPEIPVSRIPDGYSPELIINCLNAPFDSKYARFGIRNLARPFADLIYHNVPGEILRNIEISESFHSSTVVPKAPKGAVYFMLHGSETDGTRFWGETQNGRFYEALNIHNIPHSAPGSVIFTGCCWGALICETPAYRANNGHKQKNVDSSIALKYLEAGALAFVGCTGSHYSPLHPPFDYFGKPMHDHFWMAISKGNSPAEALFLAKKEFAKNIPHGRTDPFSQAVEVKILRQFTCIGLGW